MEMLPAVWILRRASCGSMCVCRCSAVPCKQFELASCNVVVAPHATTVIGSMVLTKVFLCVGRGITIRDVGHDAELLLWVSEWVLRLHKVLVDSSGVESCDEAATWTARRIFDST